MSALYGVHIQAGLLTVCLHVPLTQGPGILRLVFGGLRGYRGNISPASALDTISREGNAVIVDIRTDREKESAGVPDLPGGNRLIDCEYAAITDRRLRGQLRNVKDIERQVCLLSCLCLLAHSTTH